ncbi:MAG: acyl-CoA dehydrogenase family protein, partial [Acidimicrobiia bacterium]
MPIGISEDHEALHGAVRGWAERHCSPAVPRFLLDADREELPGFWSELAGQGWLGLHVDEALGGEGYGLPELAVVLEELGRVGAPGPFLATALAAAVLQAAGKEIAADLVPALVAGDHVGAVALDGALAAAESDDGLRVQGTLRPVLSGHLAALIVAPAGAAGWVVLTADDFTARELPSLDLARRMAEVTVDGAVVPPTRRLPDLATDRVLELAAVLVAAECVGGAQWCVDAAAEHARERRQFGRPIGQFQGVKHRCADMVCRTELARAAAWDAARADDDGDVASLTAAAAAALAVEAFYACAKDCVQ